MRSKRRLPWAGVLLAFVPSFLARPVADTKALRDRRAPDSERIYGEIEAAFGADRLAHLLAELHDLAGIADANPAREAS